MTRKKDIFLGSLCEVLVDLSLTISSGIFIERQANQRSRFCGKQSQDKDTEIEFSRKSDFRDKNFKGVPYVCRKTIMTPRNWILSVTCWLELNLWLKFCDCTFIRCNIVNSNYKFWRAGFIRKRCIFVWNKAAFSFINIFIQSAYHKSVFRKTSQHVFPAVCCFWNSATSLFLRIIFK